MLVLLPNSVEGFESVSDSSRADPGTGAESSSPSSERSFNKPTRTLLRIGSGEERQSGRAMDSYVQLRPVCNL